MKTSIEVISKPNVPLMFVALLFGATLTMGYLQGTSWLIDTGFISKTTFGIILIVILALLHIALTKLSFFNKKRLKTKDWFIAFPVAFIGMMMWAQLLTLPFGN